MNIVNENNLIFKAQQNSNYIIINVFFFKFHNVSRAAFVTTCTSIKNVAIPLHV